MKKSSMLLSCSLVVLLLLPGFVHAFGDEIVVGVMVPLTKKGASYGVQSRAATEVAVEEINAALHLRAPGQTPFTSPRKEPDIAEILSGVGMETAPPLRGYVRFISKPTAETILTVDVQ